jgi:hypothetical protein
VSALVFAAFEALGMGATKRDVASVAEALRQTGDPGGVRPVRAAGP